MKKINRKLKMKMQMKINRKAQMKRKVHMNKKAVSPTPKPSTTPECNKTTFCQYIPNWQGLIEVKKNTKNEAENRKNTPNYYAERIENVQKQIDGVQGEIDKLEATKKLAKTEIELLRKNIKDAKDLKKGCFRLFVEQKDVKKCENDYDKEIEKYEEKIKQEEAKINGTPNPKNPKVPTRKGLDDKIKDQEKLLPDLEKKLKKANEQEAKDLKTISDCDEIISKLQAQIDAVKKSCKSQKITIDCNKKIIVTKQRQSQNFK